MTAASPFPVVFDRPLVRARLARAIRSGGADFLAERASEDLVERLLPVQRAFRDILDIGSPRLHAAETLARLRPEATLVRAAPLPETLGSGPWLGLVADEEANPFAPARFDLAVSLLGLQSVNDLPGALVQIRRSLKPDGLFLAALLGGQTLQELRSALAEAEADISGGASPRVAPFSDLRDLGGLLQRTGYALPVTDFDRVTVRYRSILGLFGDLRAMGLTSALVDRRRGSLGRALLMRTAEIYADRFADPDGKLRCTFDIVWLSGWAPHESQQKPLKPGSAKMRLADALGVRERPLGGGD